MQNDSRVEDGTFHHTMAAAVRRDAPAVSISSDGDNNVSVGDATSSRQKEKVPSSPLAAVESGSNQLHVPNGHLKKLLIPPPINTRLQVPSVSSSVPPSPTTLAPASPSLPLPSPSSAKTNIIPNNNNEQHNTNASLPPNKQSSDLPLGLREVMEKYRKEYLKELFHVIKLNLIVIIIGCIFAFVGIGMMVYSTVEVLKEIHEAELAHTMSDNDFHMDALVEMFDKLGAVLAGIGAFINMVSIAYILDQRAIFDRERTEKIDTFKKNRQQPRNLFEILLANARRREREGQQNGEPGVVVITETPPADQPEAAIEPTAATGSIKTSSIKGDAPQLAPDVPAPPNNTLLRRPSVSSAANTAVRQRLGSNTMVKQMAAVTKEQLKQYSKAKGENVDVYVVSHHPQRPSSRSSLASSARRRMAKGNADLPEAALQVHKSLENWLKTSVSHTLKNEFATEAESETESETMSISIASDQVSLAGAVLAVAGLGNLGGDGSLPASRSEVTTPEPTFPNIADPCVIISVDADGSSPAEKAPAVEAADRAKKRKSKSSHNKSRLLPGTNVPIRNVFQQMYQAQKNTTQMLYDSPSTDRETPLPPPVRVSAHYAHRLQQQQQLQVPTNNSSVGTSRHHQQQQQQQQQQQLGDPNQQMWATSSSSAMMRGGVPSLATSNNNKDPYKSVAFDPNQLPPLPSTSTPRIGSSKPPLPGHAALRTAISTPSGPAGAGMSSSRPGTGATPSSTFDRRSSMIAPMDPNNFNKQPDQSGRR